MRQQKEKIIGGRIHRYCPSCGQYLYRKENSYKRKNVWGSYCKECEKRRKREAYQRHAVGDGLIGHNDGRARIKIGHSMRIYWSPEKVKNFKWDFPVMRNADLAHKYNVSNRTVARRAREMGLEKDEQWLQETWDENRRMAQRAAKISRRRQDLTAFLAAGEKYRFRGGHRNMTEEQKMAMYAKISETRRKRERSGYYIHARRKRQQEINKSDNGRV